MTTDDPFDLDRFVRAQRGVHEQALQELRRGRKTSHWMWFVFPQLAGLGGSPTAARYGISGRAEARAYLAHDVLGPRLEQAMRAAADAPAPDVEALLGWTDALKLRSSATLFLLTAGPADGSDVVFRSVLDRWYGGVPDERTVRMLGSTGR